MKQSLRCHSQRLPTGSTENSEEPALWTARAVAEEVAALNPSDTDLAPALQRYALRRRAQHRGKRICCQAFQGIIRRPAVSNAVLGLLSWRQGVGDAFIGLIGNIYSPGQAAWKMMKALT